MRAVRRYRILELPPDRVFERIAALAARMCSAPMAKVSIVDRDRIWFMAVHGFDQELKQVGRAEGLCAAVITDQIPQLASNALEDPRTAQNPFVLQHEIRFYACAPITTPDGYRLGTVTVMDSRERTASGNELAMLDELARIVMEQLEWQLSSITALQGERLLRDDARRDRDLAEQERDVIEEYATVLQQTLLPPMLPSIPGLTLAAHYHPASPRDIGGDFYDVFALGDGRWAFFIGDVEGHGVGAAVATSLIRYTLRAAALHYHDPTEALVELNEVLLREMRPRRFCTLLYGTLEPDAETGGFLVSVATGGHPPGLLVTPVEGTVQPVRSKGGMLVGAVADARFESCTTQLRPGSTLLLYTDGIIEARRGATPFDEGALADFVLGHADGGAAGLIAELARLVPELKPDDDVALLAIGAPPA